MAQLKPINSYRDSRGMIVIACCECKRGGNGHRDCSAGWDVKWGDQGCFAGELLEKYDPEQVIDWQKHLSKEQVRRERARA